MKSNYKREHIEEYLVDCLGYSHDDLEDKNTMELLELVESKDEMDNYLEGEII